MNCVQTVLWLLVTVAVTPSVVLGLVQLSLEEEGAFFLRGVTQEGQEQQVALALQGRATVWARLGPFAVRQTLQSQGWAANTSVGASVTAHLVTSAARRGRPLVRVLFHVLEAGDSPGCVALFAERAGGPWAEVPWGSCAPGPDGACLAQLTLPASWWPPLWGPGLVKSPWVVLRFSPRPPGAPECYNQEGTARPPSGAVPLGRLPLAPMHTSYEEVSGDGMVRLLVPQGPLHPGARVYVPVLVHWSSAQPQLTFSLRAKVKPGLHIVAAQVRDPAAWNVTVHINSKRTAATVTAAHQGGVPPPNGSGEEVLDWLLEVEEGHEEGRGQVAWHLRYHAETPDHEEGLRFVARFDVHKDDVEAVLLVAKSTQLLNSAVLTGRQVSQPMRVFVVSQAGLLGDVTLQSSCVSADESVLKVSPSCTSVYLDGSEVRGSQNATVVVRYGSYEGQARFLVWMPQLPLELRLSDPKLSQLRGWRVPSQPQRAGLSASWNSHQRDKHQGGGCRLRYQQATLDVWTRFLSVDHNSGRESYLLGRRAQARITHLVGQFLRVADPRVATLVQDHAVQGLRPGRTEVQVVSPLSGRILGAAEVRVNTDKESVLSLRADLVTGLSLELTPDETPGVFLARVNSSKGLSSLYQEGLLDISVLFSDGTATALQDLPETDYTLTAESQDSGVVAVAPQGPSAALPRIIALGHGRGSLLQVSLDVPEACQRRRSGPLAQTRAHVECNLVPVTDGVLYRDGTRAEPPPVPAVEARQDTATHRSARLSPLELAVYAALGTCCLVVAGAGLAVASCARQRWQRPQRCPGVDCHESDSQRQPMATNAHDWVWLGRATLERSSVNTRCSQALLPPEKPEKPRVQVNPMMLTFTRGALPPPPVPPHRVAPPTLAWDELTKGMHYNQLVEYLDSLKESSA